MQHWPVRPLLLDPSRGAITSPAAWQARAADIRALFQETIGPTPPSQRLHGYAQLKHQNLDGIERQLLRVQVDHDEFMEVYLLQPADPARRNGRAALAVHQTTGHGKDEVVGDAGHPDLAYGIELARRGWTVAAPDLFAIQRRLPPAVRDFETGPFYERFPHWSAVGKTVSDLRITLDLMEQLPQTRGVPVSAIGHSLGGHAVMFLAALDPRPVCVVNNCGFYPFSDGAARAHFFRDHWYIYFKHPGLKQSVVHGPQPLWDMHELAALIAPRRSLILAAGNDELIQSQSGLTQMTGQLHDLYHFLNAGPGFAAILHGDGHGFAPWHRAAAYSFMER